jgi:hypothetical protein
MYDYLEKTDDFTYGTDWSRLRIREVAGMANTVIDAPVKLSDESTTIELVAWLTFADPDGCYSPEDMIDEGCEPMGEHQAWDCVEAIVNNFL